MWKNLNTTKAGRDFGYVEEIHLNALRVRASYEYWRMGSARFQTELDECLAALPIQASEL